MLFNSWAGGASLMLGWHWVIGLLGGAAAVSAAAFALVDLEADSKSKQA